MPSTPPQLDDKLLDEIREKLWTYGIFVLKVRGGRAYPWGAATCVTIGGKPYLLTAAHVWDTARGGEVAFGVWEDGRLKPHRLEIFEETVLIKGTQDELGPDLALICLPDLVAREIGEEKAFYDLLRPRPLPVENASRRRDLWAIVGAADEQSVYGSADVEHRLSLFDEWRIRCVDRGGFDYCDLVLNRALRQGLPESYQGVSGSGLWQVPLMFSSDGLGCTWNFYWIRLAGVAFYGISEVEGEQVIRCHGPKSLQSQVVDVIQRNSKA
jgi:hypothetical protein